MSVKRYEHYVDSDGGWDIGDAYSAMREEPDGDYVKAEDYDALRAAAGKVIDVITDPLMSQWSYVENGRMYEDLDNLAADLRALLGEKP